MQDKIAKFEERIDALHYEFCVETFSPLVRDFVNKYKMDFTTGNGTWVFTSAIAERYFNIGQQENNIINLLHEHDGDEWESQEEIDLLLKELGYTDINLLRTISDDLAAITELLNQCTPKAGMCYGAWMDNINYDRFSNMG